MAIVSKYLSDCYKSVLYGTPMPKQPSEKKPRRTARAYIVKDCLRTGKIYAIPGAIIDEDNHYFKRGKDFFGANEWFESLAEAKEYAHKKRRRRIAFLKGEITSEKKYGENNYVLINNLEYEIRRLENLNF